MNLKNVILGFYKAIFKWDKYFRYSIFSRIINLFYPKMIHTEYGKYFLQDTDFIKFYTKFEGNNFNSLDRKYTVLQFLKLIKRLSWDTAECWVFRGATSYLILENIDIKKTHHIFDSFEWLSKPSSIDWEYWDESNLSAGEDIVKENLKKFNNTKYYKWWIPTKFNEVSDVVFSFVHIDVDLYEPTKDSLEFFYPRLEKWWIIICDDYGFITCPWARKAMDEYVDENGLEILELTTGQGVIIKD